MPRAAPEKTDAGLIVTLATMSAGHPRGLALRAGLARRMPPVMLVNRLPLPHPVLLA